jgi:uncharacterized protein (TIGR02246 family)
MSASPQQTDEQQIRALVDTWAEAAQKGDLAALLNLVTDDVVFLTPGNIPMRREDFISAFKSVNSTISFEARSNIQEITVTDDLAVCWNLLEIRITPSSGGTTVKRAGNTLTVLRRGTDGQWRIWRDANMLAPE